MFLLFVMLIPFFGFNELRRVFGGERLVGVFFRPRYLTNLPPTGARRIREAPAASLNPRREPTTPNWR